MTLQLQQKQLLSMSLPCSKLHRMQASLPEALLHLLSSHSYKDAAANGTAHLSDEHGRHPHRHRHQLLSEAAIHGQ